MLIYTDKDWVIIIMNDQKSGQFFHYTYIVLTFLIILAVPSSAISWSISVLIIIIVAIIIIIIIVIIIIIIVYSPKFFFSFL